MLERRIRETKKKKRRRRRCDRKKRTANFWKVGEESPSETELEKKREDLTDEFLNNLENLKFIMADFIIILYNYENPMPRPIWQIL